MPLYTFKNLETDEEFESFMSYSEAKVMEKSGKYKWLPSPIRLVSGHGDVRSKTSDSLTDVFKNMKKAFPGSTIETK